MKYVMLLATALVGLWTIIEGPAPVIVLAGVALMLCAGLALVLFTIQDFADDARKQRGWSRR